PRATIGASRARGAGGEAQISVERQGVAAFGFRFEFVGHGLGVVVGLVVGLGLWGEVVEVEGGEVLADRGSPRDRPWRRFGFARLRCWREAVAFGGRGLAPRA